MTEVVEQRRVQKITKTHHKNYEDSPKVQKKIIDITIQPVDDNNVESYVVNRSSADNGEIKESTVIKQVQVIKDPTKYNHNGLFIEAHQDKHNGHNAINNGKTHGQHVIKLDDSATQKQIVDVIITPVEEDNLEKEIVNSKTIKETFTIVTSGNDDKHVNGQLKDARHLKVAHKKEFDIRSVELNRKPSMEIIQDNLSVRSVGEGKHWEIKSIKSIDDEFRLLPKLQPEQESLEKVENYLKSQDSNFILVNDNKVDNIQHPPNTADNFNIENPLDKHIHLNINYIKSIDGDKRSSRSNSVVMEKKWTESHLQNAHSSTSEIEIKEPENNLSYTIENIGESNYNNKNTDIPMKKEVSQNTKSSTVEMQIHSPKPEIDFLNIKVNKNNITPDISGSIITKEEWNEYHQIPIETERVDVLNQYNETKRNYDTEMSYPIDSIRSRNSNTAYFNNKFSENQNNPIGTSGYEIGTKYYSSRDLHDSYVPSMFNTDPIKKSDSVIMKDEWTEFRKVPIYSTSSNSIIHKENSTSNITYPQASKIYDHYSYRYEDPIKTEKLQNLASATSENMTRTSQASARVVQSIYDSLSRKHKPMLPSTDCLKQTFHVDHEDEELLHTPVIYDANGEKIENLFETNNFQSVTEYVTLRISDLKALIKIEISVEMFHNINPIEDNWKRKTVRLTRMIELDLSKIKDSRELQNIMKRCRMDKPQISWNDENGNVVNQYNQENILTGKETFDVFFNLLSITHEEEEQCQPSNIVKDEFYLTRSPSGQITNVPCEPQYLMNGYSNMERSYLYY